MKACAACLQASVLRSEGLVHAETHLAGRVDAARLLRMEPRQMLTELRRSHPTIDHELAEAVEALQSSAAVPADGWFVCRHDPIYPQGLTHFDDAADIPAVLYGVGRPELLEGLDAAGSVAIVGARRASAYGREIAYSLGRDAAAAGLIVVSGMALGIDGAAHRGALQAGGQTIAVLAGGAESPYPRSHRLLHEQIRTTGCVISENPPGSVARRWAFVARNRVIAALGQMTVFVEGSEESGAGHTVRFAQDLGLPVGAVPGPVSGPMSTGPNALLAASAAGVVRGITDILDELGLGGTRRQLENFGVADLPALDRAVLELIAAGDRAPRAICQSLPEHPSRAITQALGALELRGCIVRGADGEYQLTAGTSL